MEACLEHRPDVARHRGRDHLDGDTEQVPRCQASIASATSAGLSAIGKCSPPGHDRLGQSRPQAPPPPAEEEVIAKLSEHGQRRSPRQGRSSLPRLLWQAAITGGVSNIWCGKRRLAWSRRPLRHARRFRRSQCRPAPNRVALPQASSPSHALSSRTTPEPNKRSASRKAPRGAPGFSDKRRYAISL